MSSENARIPLVDLFRMHSHLMSDLNNAFEENVKDSSFIGGTPVKTFEEKFASYCGVNEAAGAANGTVALEIALRVAGIKSGDEVITVANTFFATVEAILNVGAVPIFVDICQDNGLMDLNQLPKLITKKTRAVIPVHLFGHLVNIEALTQILTGSEIRIIEDAAQAHGAKGKWGGPGTKSDAATFSFYPGKNLGALGDAGAIVSNNSEFIKMSKKIMDHGRTSKYSHDIIGTNARMDSIQASFLSRKMPYLDQWNLRRTEIATEYTKHLTPLGFSVVANETFDESSWHLFPVKVRNRLDVMNYLKEKNIETGIHYPIPLHKQSALASSYKNTFLPITEKFCEAIISLPIHPYLNDEEIFRIIRAFGEIAQPS